MLDITHVDDLRQAYLQIFDSFAASTADLAHGHINSRYARELSATLAKAGLVELTENSEGEEYWQVVDPGTYDNYTREEAEARFNEWASVKPAGTGAGQSATARSSLKSGATGPHPCGCGCGETITSRAVYRPGHDARHAGEVARSVAEQVMATGGGLANLETDADRFEVLPSAALREKALKMANRILAKKMAQGKNRTLTRNTKPEKVLHVEGTAKVGKNEVVARKWADGTVEFLPASGGDWTKASATATKTFQEG